MERIFTLLEVAEALKVSVETVRNWIRAGQLEAFRATERGPYRVTEEALRRMTGAPQQ